MAKRKRIGSSDASFSRPSAMIAACFQRSNSQYPVGMPSGYATAIRPAHETASWWADESQSMPTVVQSRATRAGERAMREDGRERASCIAGARTVGPQQPDGSRLVAVVVGDARDGGEDDARHARVDEEVADKQKLKDARLALGVARAPPPRGDEEVDDRKEHGVHDHVRVVGDGAGDGSAEEGGTFGEGTTYL